MSSVETIITFLRSLATDGQTDGQARCVKPLLLSSAAAYIIQFQHVQTRPSYFLETNSFVAWAVPRGLLPRTKTKENIITF